MKSIAHANIRRLRKPGAVLAGLILLGPLFWTVSAPNESREATEALHREFDALDSIQLGDSEKDLTAKIGNYFTMLQTNTYCSRYPFNRLLPDAKGAVIAEWRSRRVEADGWPEIVFAFFSDEAKTNLVDALWFRSDDLRPLVDGLYCQNLRATQKGDSIQRVYSGVGQRKCDYFKTDSGE